MRKLYVFITIVGLSLFLFRGILLSVSAQDFLTYGDTVEGTITNQNFEIEYRFSGKAGDVVIVEMISSDQTLFNKLEAPFIALLDQTRRPIVNTLGAVPVDDAILVVELETTSDYFINVGREGGRNGNSEGKFTLELIKAPELSPGDSIRETASTEDTSQYFVVRSDEAFSVDYFKLDGDFNPHVAVNLIDPERGGLRIVGEVYGELVTQARLGAFDMNLTYVITISQYPFEYYFEPATVEYELNISTNQ
jgi:hypothetical protein